MTGHYGPYGATLRQGQRSTTVGRAHAGGSAGSGRRSATLPHVPSKKVRPGAGAGDSGLVSGSTVPLPWSGDGREGDKGES